MLFAIKSTQWLRPFVCLFRVWQHCNVLYGTLGRPAFSPPAFSSLLGAHVRGRVVFVCVCALPSRLFPATNSLMDLCVSTIHVYLFSMPCRLIFAVRQSNERRYQLVWRQGLGDGWAGIGWSAGTQQAMIRTGLI